MSTPVSVSPETRSEVRARLAQALKDLIGGETRRAVAAEFSALATGSDREVIESYRRFDNSYHSRGPGDENIAPSAIALQIKELFAKALQTMKTLPPDPPVAVPDTPPTASALAKVGRKR